MSHLLAPQPSPAGHTQYLLCHIPLAAAQPPSPKDSPVHGPCHGLLAAQPLPAWHPLAQLQAATRHQHHVSPRGLAEEKAQDVAPVQDGKQTGEAATSGVCHAEPCDCWSAGCGDWHSSWAW